MLTFLVWLLLLVVFWPLAILALIIYPLIWILRIPFRLLGITIDGALELLKQIIRLPASVMRKINEQ